MRAALLLLVVSTAYASVVPYSEIGVEKEYPRFIDFPDGDGNLHRVDLEEAPIESILREIRRTPADNLYLLFTRNNPDSSQVLEMNSYRTVQSSNFNPNVPTVVIVHGWLSHQNTGINPLIRDAHLTKKDVNVIVLDWKRLARAPYTTAVRGVPDIGRGLGQFIRFLCETTGAKLSDFHIVGFSLGAHVAGNAGKELGGQVARITGLDPAGPLWSRNENSINDNDAIYVEGIHTDGGLNGLGIGTAIGNVDFFPNGGTNQPGCITGVCDHNRAWELFAASVSYDHFIGRECSSNLQITMNNCRGSTFRMGNGDLHKFGSGKYRVNTDRKYPF